jgi:pantetheine-phosphate adenylyltransferase
MENIQPLISIEAKDAFEYFGINFKSREDLISKLSEKHRYYHNVDHINNLIDMVGTYDASKYSHNLSSIERKLLIVIALYHDAIYNVGSPTNEDDSAEYFISQCTKNRLEEMQIVASVIRDTKNHTPSSKLSEIFCDFDLRGLKEGDFLSLLENEKKIFLEFQKYDYSDYKKGRIDFLQSFLEKHTVNTVNILALIDYVKFRVPKIGVYAGSFNPLHKGHLNIVEKAEKIFDKVIIAKGINPEKSSDKLHQRDELENLRREQNFRQVETFNGLITDYIIEKSKDADITLIRGLRNGNDLSYEMNQLKFIKEFDSSVKSIFIHCDQEFEHISSSAIRSLLSSSNESVRSKASYYT